MDGCVAWDRDPSVGSSVEWNNRIGSAVVLTSANFLRPGGGYEKDAWAQEEALCADSNLYPILRGMKGKYYDENCGYARGQLYMDRAMLLPDVQFIRNGNYKVADVIVMAAPNRQRSLENHRSEVECGAELRHRIEAIMCIARARRRYLQRVHAMLHRTDGIEVVDWGADEQYANRRRAHIDGFRVERIANNLHNQDVSKWIY